MVLAVVCRCWSHYLQLDMESSICTVTVIIGYLCFLVFQVAQYQLHCHQCRFTLLNLMSESDHVDLTFSADFGYQCIYCVNKEHNFQASINRCYCFQLLLTFVRSEFRCSVPGWNSRWILFLSISFREHEVDSEL